MPQQNFPIPVARFGDAPPEGFATTPIVYQFDGGATLKQLYSGDYVLGQARGFFTQVRTVFVDNSASASPLIIVWGSGQAINVAAYSQGFYPVLSPGDIRFTVASNGGTAGGIITVTVFLINVLLPCSVWSVRGLPISVNYNGSGDQQIPLFNPVAVRHNTIQASDNTILTGNPGYFIRGFDVYISAGATLAVAGDLSVSLSDSTTGVLWTGIITLPAVPFAINQPTLIRLQTPEQWMFTAKANNTSLSVVLSAALTAGFLSYNLNYGLTAFVG